MRWGLVTVTLYLTLIMAGVCVMEARAGMPEQNIQIEVVDGTPAWVQYAIGIGALVPITPLVIAGYRYLRKNMR